MGTGTIGARVLIVSCCILGCGISLLAPTNASAVQILVKDRNGTPIPNVDLCLSLPNQSFRKMTDQNGRYDFALPLGSTGPATVRTSRNGFINNQATINLNLSEQTIVLLPGQATPLPNFCGSITATTNPGNSCPNIADVRVQGGVRQTDRNIHLEILFDAGVQYYRIVEFTDEERYPEAQFDPERAMAKKNGGWIPHTSTTQVAAFFTIHPRYGTHAIYVQASGPLQGCVSRPRGITVILEPARFQTYELDKKDILRFLNAANSRGYQFKSHFEFIKKHHGYCVGNAMVEPIKPSLDARTSTTPLEDIAATFEVFIGPDLMPFWELKDIEGVFPGLPPFDFSNNRIYGSRPNRNDVKYAYNPPYPSMAFTKYSEVSCPYCTPQALTRTLSWRRLVYPFVTSGHLDNTNTTCVTPPDLRRPDQQPSIVKLTLRGPAGEDPIHALGDLRVNTLQGIQRIAPGQIIPRAVDEQGQPDQKQVDSEPARMGQNP